MSKILLTGGSGFIGHHFVEHLLKTTDHEVIILDRLDTSGNLNRLTDIDTWQQYKHRVKFLFCDLKAEINSYLINKIGQVDYIIHLAASTHVDRSITNPMEFVMDNVVGTTNLLNFARTPEKGGTQKNLKLFINFSTDEVFGPAKKGYFNKEEDPHRPSNPYAASKAGAVDMGYAYFITYGVPVINTHTMNNFGERQTPEKLIPKAIRMIQEGKPMPIFAEWKDGKMTAVGSRFWIHARETAKALTLLIEKGVPGEYYNIIGFDERTNLEICEIITKAIGKPLIPDFIDWHSSRPGHDTRYALDGTKLKKLGFKQSVPLEESLTKTVRWTLAHPNWQ